MKIYQGMLICIPCILMLIWIVYDKQGIIGTWLRMNGYKSDEQRKEALPLYTIFYYIILSMMSAFTASVVVITAILLVESLVE